MDIFCALFNEVSSSLSKLKWYFRVPVVFIGLIMFLVLGPVALLLFIIFGGVTMCYDKCENCLYDPDNCNCCNCWCSLLQFFILTIIFAVMGSVFFIIIIPFVYIVFFFFLLLILFRWCCKGRQSKLSKR